MEHMVTVVPTTVGIAKILRYAIKSMVFVKMAVDKDGSEENVTLVIAKKFIPQSCI